MLQGMVRCDYSAWNVQLIILMIWILIELINLIEALVWQYLYND